MNLNTIIFKYRDGTYISQVKAKDVNEAFYTWGKEINPDSIEFMSEKLKAKLNNEIAILLSDAPSSLIDNTKNCWCAGSVLSGLVNIIQTVQT